MVELVMRKRKGREGEIGLFVDSPVWEDDVANIKEGVDVKVVATTPRSIRQLKFAWALAKKIADACDWLHDKDDAMYAMLVGAKHCRWLTYPDGKSVLRALPTNFGAMDGTLYSRLLNRMIYVAVTEIVPGMDESALKAEIEAMIFEPASAAPASSTGGKGAGVRRGARHRNPQRSGDANGGSHV